MSVAYTVNDYIAHRPPPAQRMLKTIRATIRQAAPQAIEKMSYGMPYYHYHGRVAYFAAFRDHVSFFAMMSQATRIKFKKQLQPYQTGKATLRFPLGTKVPVRLIAQLVSARRRQIDLIRHEK